MASSKVEVHERPPRPLGERLWEKDFPESAEFDDRWWTGLARRPERCRWYSGLNRGAEVARAQIDLSSSISEAFRGVVSPKAGFVEIVFLEVAGRGRGAGFGRALVGELVDLYPDRSFAAFSEGADRFWGSLGWVRYEHEEGTRLFRPLYVLA